MAKQAGGVSRRRARVFKWVSGALGLAVMLPLALVAYLVFTESGLRSTVWLAERFSGGQVSVSGYRGRLGGDLEVARIRVDTDDLLVVIDDFRFTWHPRALLQRHFEVERLHFGAVDVSARPDEEREPEPLEPPDPVNLPVSVVVEQFRLDRLRLLPWQDRSERFEESEYAADDDENDEALEPPTPIFELHDIATRLASDGRVHRIDHLSLITPFGELGLSVEIDAGQLPFLLSAEGAFKGSHEGYHYALGYTARGDLDRLHVDITGQGAGVDGDATFILAPFEKVPLRHLQAAIGDIDPSEFVTDAPRALLRIEAELAAESDDEWRLSGPLRIDNAAPESVDEGGLPLTHLAANLAWSPSTARIEALDIGIPGEGKVTGDLAWQPDEDGETLGRLTAALELAGIRTERLDARLPPAVIAGNIDAEGDERQQDADIDLRVGDARLVASGWFRPPVDDVPGEFSAFGALDAFSPAALLADAPRGDLNLDFEAAGSLADEPVIDAQWAFRPSSLDGRSVGGRGVVSVVGQRLADADIDTLLAGNRVTARGAWGRTQDSLSVLVDAPELDRLDFLGLGGAARLEGTLGGTMETPTGVFELSGERLRLPGEIRVGGINAQGDFAEGLEGRFNLSLDANSVGQMQGETWLDSVSLGLDGTRAEHAIDLALATPDDEDVLSLRMEGGLNVAADEPRWQGRIAALELLGRVPLSLEAPAELSASPSRVALGEAVLDAGDDGRVSLAETEWTPDRIIARGALTGLQIIESGPGRGRRGGSDPLTLGADWDVRLTQTANGRVRLFRESGDFVVPGELSTRVGLEHLELLADIEDNQVNASLDARGTELGEVEGSLAARLRREGAAGWGLDPDGALDGELRLDMPSIGWLSRLLEEETVLGGSLNAQARVSGTPDSPRATGRIQGHELSVTLVEHGVQLSGGELDAELDSDYMQVDLEFVAANRVRPADPRVPVVRFTEEPGRLTASGRVELDSGDGRFEFEADRMPILQRSDRWLLISGGGQAQSTWTSLKIDAGVYANAGYIELRDTPAPSLSDDVVIASDTTEDSGSGGLEVTADIRVSLGEHLYLAALGLETRLAGGLVLAMRPDQDLTARGTISTVGGRFQGYGQDLTIERGQINFQGPIDNPGLNVRALRKGLPVEAGVEVIGSARRPEVRLVSQPDVPDAEKLSWMVLGRAPSAGAGGDMGLLVPAAQALLGAGGISEQLEQNLGLQVGIGTGEMGAASRRPTSQVVGDGAEVQEGQVSSQVLTVGTRLSPELFLSFEQSLGGAESLVKLSYQLSRRVSVVARSGTDNSADVYYTVSFR